MSATEVTVLFYFLSSLTPPIFLSILPLRKIWRSAGIHIYAYFPLILSIISHAMWFLFISLLSNSTHFHSGHLFTSCSITIWNCRESRTYERIQFQLYKFSVTPHARRPISTVFYCINFFLPRAATVYEKFIPDDAIVRTHTVLKMLYAHIVSDGKRILMQKLQLLENSSSRTDPRSCSNPH